MAATYYVAPNGSDSRTPAQAQNIGTPFASLQRAHNVAVAGDIIYMRGGTYLSSTQVLITRSGSSGKPIKVFNYPGEVPVLDGIKQTTPSPQSFSGVVVRLSNASWWHIKGLEIKNGPTGGIVVWGTASNNILENLRVHNNGRLANGGGMGTGVLVQGSGGSNLVLNNDVYCNDDELGSGGAGNGINFVSTGSNNIIRGNRAWRNADDGIDMWTSRPALIESNWVFESGYDCNGTTLRGNGNGFKLGGSGSTSDGGHKLLRNVAWKNLSHGFHDNVGDLPMTVYNNTAWSNGGSTWANYAFYTSPSTVFKGNLSFAGSVKVKGSSSFNSWNLPVTVNSEDFASLDDRCARGPRKADGSLPDCAFLHLVAGSDLINKGTVSTGLPYTGSAPDIGAFEYSAAPVSQSPDLIVTALSYKNGIFTSTVKNQGKAATPSGVAVGVGYYVDGVYRTYGTVNAPPLSAGETSTAGTSGGSYFIPSGAHTVMAYIDSINRFDESNEDNNQFSITVGGTRPLTNCTKKNINVTAASSDGGFAWKVNGSYGTPPDHSGDRTRSVLRVFENGVEMFPAHTRHPNIREIGKGGFSHWVIDPSSGAGESLRFSASDNSNVKTNRRTYTYCIGTQ